MQRLKAWHWIAWVSLFTISFLSGCQDIVKESEGVAGCRKALNKRDYTTAIEICEERADQSAAYMGKAGYDIANLLDATSEVVTASTSTNQINALGTESVTSVTVLNTLKLSPADIADTTTRLVAIDEAKANLEKAVDLLQPVSAADLSADEIFLEMFALLFTVELERVRLFDVGVATTNYVTAITTLADGSAIPSGVLEKADGRIWTNEMYGSLSPVISSLAQFTLVCNSIRNTNTASPRGITIMLTQLTAAINKFKDKIGGDLTDSDTTQAISDSEASIRSALSLITVCP